MQSLSLAVSNFSSLDRVMENNCGHKYWDSVVYWPWLFLLLFLFLLPLFLVLFSFFILVSVTTSIWISEVWHNLAIELIRFVRRRLLAKPCGKIWLRSRSRQQEIEGNPTVRAKNLSQKVSVS